jgi:hypothetical protein
MRHNQCKCGRNRALRKGNSKPTTSGHAKRVQAGKQAGRHGEVMRGQAGRVAWRGIAGPGRQTRCDAARQARREEARQTGRHAGTHIGVARLGRTGSRLAGAAWRREATYKGTRKTGLRA